MNYKRMRDEPEDSTQPILQSLLCESCRPMASTPQGLKALVSSEGYAHLSDDMIKKSADQGCSLCYILRSHYYGPRSRSNSVRRIFAEVEPTGSYVDDSHARDCETTHPFKSGRVKRFLVNCPSARQGGHMELQPFTTSGKGERKEIHLPSIRLTSIGRRPCCNLLRCPISDHSRNERHHRGANKKAHSQLSGHA